MCINDLSGKSKSNKMAFKSSSSVTRVLCSVLSKGQRLNITSQVTQIIGLVLNVHGRNLHGFGNTTKLMGDRLAYQKTCVYALVCKGPKILRITQSHALPTFRKCIGFSYVLIVH